MKQIVTGVRGLDQVLQGGFPEYSTILLAGKPGTGKTILTQNILFNHASRTGSKVLYITTLSEPQIKVIRHQQEFSFFEPHLFDESVIYREIGSVVMTGGLDAAGVSLENLVKEHQPDMVAIDSIKAISDILVSPAKFREFVANLNLSLPLWGCTVVLVGEYSEEGLQGKPETAMADGIIYLYGMEESKHQKRYLRILKMRGTDFSPGEHSYDISSSGIEVYPRLNPVVARQDYPAGGGRQSSGIHELDRMMRGGIPVGSTTLICGSTGTCKSLLNLGWLVQGGREGEAGLLITFDQSPGEIVRVCEPFGWDLPDLIERGLLEIMHVSPMELNVDRLVYRIQKTVSDRDIRRTSLDSISSFEVGMADKGKYTDYLWSLADWFKASGVSLTMVEETRFGLGLPTVSTRKTSYIADNIIRLGYLQADWGLHRVINVLKMRGSDHEMAMRELVVDGRGPTVHSEPICRVLSQTAAKETAFSQGEVSGGV